MYVTQKSVVSLTGPSSLTYLSADLWSSSSALENLYVRHAKKCRIIECTQYTYIAFCRSLIIIKRAGPNHIYATKWWRMIDSIYHTYILKCHSQWLTNAVLCQIQCTPIKKECKIDCIIHTTIFELEKNCEVIPLTTRLYFRVVRRSVLFYVIREAVRDFPQILTFCDQ